MVMVGGLLAGTDEAPGEVELTADADDGLADRLAREEAEARVGDLRLRCMLPMAVSAAVLGCRSPQVASTASRTSPVIKTTWRTRIK